ncbi:LOW QUALITY PROTEIN: phospholipid-transporting ATPase ABCA1-like [Lethenteron reissneri]|uniref:LOW QUALITY PROTEIN: phospholipid-transporting ATPase ABCA1-like n=1 Tax=Lethenteron reissneri TaxID=7753 RepID=UPI002AB63D0D|nr:LOW QUALITY PROTEIN: phospholipid-transporting ATPase ABCA1-like [Lethenteron reissneri]
MAFWTQLRLLLWKNFTLRKRQKVRLLLELTWPLFLFVILVLVRNTQLPYMQHQCYFPNKPLPSAGALPWLQGVLCNANNPCFSQPTPGETPGQLNNFGGSIVSRLIGDIQHLLSNETQMERFDEALEDVQGLSHLAETLRYRPNVVAGRGVRVRDFLREHENLTLFMQRDMGLPRQVSTEILEMRVRLEQFVEGIPSLSLKEIACDDQLLRHFLVFRSARACSTVRSALCFLPQPRLQQLEDVLYANVDFYRLLREMSFVLDDVSPRLSADGWREVTTSLANLFRQFTSLQSFTSLMREASFLNGLGLAENTSDGLREEQVGPVLSSLSGLLCGHPEAGGRKILSFNWYEDNDYKTFLGIDDNDDDGGGNDEERQGGRRQHQYDNSTTPFCNALLQGLQTNSASRFAWTMLQPLLQGKILYAPDTPATRSIMHEANRTFAELEMIYKFGLAWEEVAPQIWDFLNSSLALRLLRETLGNAAVATFVDSQLSDTGLDARTIADFLSEGPSRERGNGTAPGWREVFMVVDLAIRSLTRFLECMELDKLEGVQDEPGLERRALELLEERKLWAGVVFLDLFSPSALPQHLRYKIRTDIDRTERTSKSRDRYWDPGPRADAAEDMSYIWGGFAYLQDMVERGIVQAQTGAATMGLYLQQMPYPCFVDDPFTTYIGNILPMFMTLAFILPVCLIIKSIVWEKERRLKEVLRASGLGRGTLWAAWFTDSVLTMVVSCAFLAVIIKVGGSANRTRWRFSLALSRCFALFMVLSWVFAVSMAVKNVVLEKELRLRETMRSMGLDARTLWLAWFIDCLVSASLSNVLLTLLLMYGKVLQYSDPLVLFLFLTAFAVATVSQCFLLSVFFSRANLAAACGGLAYFLLYLPHILCFMWQDYLTFPIKMGVSLLSTVAFGFGCESISRLEEQGIGIQWHNLASNPAAGESYTLLTSLLMMLCDAVIYGLLTWYIEAVFPGQYGVPKPWHFPFTSCVTTLGPQSPQGTTSSKPTAAKGSSATGPATIATTTIKGSKQPEASKGEKVAQKGGGQEERNSGKKGGGDKGNPGGGDGTDKRDSGKRGNREADVSGTAVNHDRRVAWSADIAERASKKGKRGARRSQGKGQGSGGVSRSKEKKSTTKATKRTNAEPDGHLNRDEVLVEEESVELTLGVSVQNLVKKYSTMERPAVDGLSLNFYQDQITSFLGHNGAGKTTTMSILTGLFPPTSGTALIYGKDIRTEMESIRSSLGTCPQHNVLFNQLTVEEHIWFYARLKGCSSEDVKEEVERMLEDTGLLMKRAEQAGNLSGGMQRKLSVAMAFVAGSRLVILDEPTAGVDPFARRGIWELLLKYKHGRTIILSTHHMDEAETLGDRIAVIARGRLRCCGSSLFLKSCYGTGYYLTVVRSGADVVGPSERASSSRQKGRGKAAEDGGGGGDLDTNEDETDGSSSHNSSSDEGFSSERSLEEKLPGEVLILQSLVERLVPGARVVENVGQEVTFVLPYIGARDGSFALLFSHLDSKLEGLGISSYGVSDTTMEEIFLKVAEDPSLETEHKDEGVSTKGRGRWWKDKSSLSPSKTKENMDTELERRLEEKKAKRQKKLDPGGGGTDHKITGGALSWQQFRALIIKRFHHTRRSRKGFLSQIILPAVFVCLALVFTMIVPPFADYPVLELQPWMYPEQFTFYSDDAPNDLTTQKLVAAILDPPGLGTRCMMGYSIPNLPCQPRMPVWETPQASQAALDALNEGNWTFEDPSPSCQCSTLERLTMLPDCPPGAGGLPPPQMLQSTTDTLQNLTGRNISDYLVKTYAGFIEKSLKRKYWVNEPRYGGFSLGQKNEQSDVNATALRRLFQQAGGFLNITAGPATEEASRNLEGFIQALGPTDNIKVWFNNKGWHAIVAFINVASNAVLRARLPEGQDPRRFGITAYSHPLNLTKQQLTEVAMLTSSVDVMVAICVIFSMSLIPASFVVFLVQERASNAKHLQFVSGVNAYVYWLANITWDMCNYILPAIIVVVIFLSFQQKAYVSDRNLPALILLLLLYGWSITPLMYPASFVFTVPSTAYVVLTCVNMFIGINGSMATYILELFNGDETLTRINDILKSVLLIFPHFCLGRGLIDMATNQALADASERFGESRFREPLSWDMVGKNLVAMFIEGSVFIVLTLLIQKNFFIRPRSMELNLPPITDEDVDVAAERKRVMEGDTSTDILTINELTKVYKKKGAPAVDRMCIGVRPGECFGLLGVNGAGKTSAFRMLTGDTHATAGDARLEGYSILSQLSSVQSHLGYCPQFDGTDELLTGREHLQLYARLRGVREDDLERVVDWAVSTLGLIYIADRSAGSYSGGNKRKLSTAIALIGNPPLVFLDEPTTGMDPKARRFLWNCILAIVQAGRSVVLTSHSMEECESLCTRMAIMVSGTFRCLGSVQHIKTRFGEGHTLVIRLAAATPPAAAAAATADPAAADTAAATAADPATAVAEYVCKRFPRTELREHHHRTMYFHLPGATTTHGASAGDTAAASAYASLSTIFAALSENQQQLGIADFSVSQTTLDQVFVSFARQQRTDPVDEETGV